MSRRHACRPATWDVGTWVAGCHGSQRPNFTTRGAGRRAHRVLGVGREHLLVLAEAQEGLRRRGKCQRGPHAQQHGPERLAAARSILRSRRGAPGRSLRAGPDLAMSSSATQCATGSPAGERDTPAEPDAATGGAIAPPPGISTPPQPQLLSPASPGPRRRGGTRRRGGRSPSCVRAVGRGSGDAHRAPGRPRHRHEMQAAHRADDARTEVAWDWARSMAIVDVQGIGVWGRHGAGTDYN